MNINSPHGNAWEGLRWRVRQTVGKFLVSDCFRLRLHPKCKDSVSDYDFLRNFEA